MNQCMERFLLSTGLAYGLLFSQCTATAQSDNAPQQPTQAQSQSSAPSEQNGMPRLAPGSIIPVQLTKTLDAKKAKPGDEVVAKVTQDLKRQDGQVIVPKDTEVVGHVTEAQPRTKEAKESQLGIAFDHAVVKEKGNMTLPASIQAVIGPQNLENGGGSNGMGQSPAPSSTGGGMSPGGGRGQTGSATPAPPNVPPGESGSEAGMPSPAPQITGNTQGVVGLKNLKLSPATDPKQGSVLSSDKNNVKLESGTMMLLRVNQ